MTNDDTWTDACHCEGIDQGKLEHRESGKRDGNGPWVAECVRRVSFGVLKQASGLDEGRADDRSIDLVKLEDALAEVTYDASLAGLSYEISNHDEGLSISIGGYNDKLDVLLRTVLEKLRDFEVAPDRRPVIAEKVGRLAYSKLHGPKVDVLMY